MGEGQRLTIFPASVVYFKNAICIERESRTDILDFRCFCRICLFMCVCFVLVCFLRRATPFSYVYSMYSTCAICTMRSVFASNFFVLLFLYVCDSCCAVLFGAT